ncbi:MAG TPA: amidohydrolase family protein, partial [Pirellulales bacterium]
MLAFRAHYVFPIDSPPIHDAIVAIDHDRIVAVAAANSPAGRDLLPAARDLGRVAILPGLINSHTHLEFSNLSEPLGSSGMPFSDWIRLVVHSRHARLAASETDPIAAGIAESIRSGTTALGEIASSPWQQEATLPLEITQFCEVICFRRDSDQQRYQTAFDAVCGTKNDSLSSIKWTEIFRPGISPHTPYSVR